MAVRACWILAALAPAALAARPAVRSAPASDGPQPGLATIVERDLRLHVDLLASAALEGRDSPSLGLEQAARYLVARFKEAGLEPASGEDLRLSFDMDAPEIVPEECRLELTLEGGERRAFELGRDFVPLPGCHGEASGELVFLGFGIEAAKEHFDELPARGLSGEIALILEGEPRHARRFDGEQVTAFASLWRKLDDLSKAGAAAVIVARRARSGSDALAAEVSGGDLAPDIGLRHQWATWMGDDSSPRPRDGARLPPVIEVDSSCAAALLGTDVEELARGADRNGRPPRFKLPAKPRRIVSLRASTRPGKVPVANVVGLRRGSDPALAAEYVVLGAHYDHVGVDERGRIGFGADDNASGTAALLELAEAFASAPPRRSLLFCAFAAEEKGLLGSKAFCDRPPVPLESLVAMINMDMLGRGDVDEIAVLGIEHYPSLEPVLERAHKLARTGVKKLVVRQGLDLWERSDHFSFHERGVPALFFFEGLPISRNADYHTSRDTIDKLDLDKIARSTRLVFNTAWLLANDDVRPPRPRD